MALEKFTRLKLAALPTPLDDAPHLTRALGGPRILIKRDDLTGLALGGNKTRKLEYLMADAMAQGADVVITAGAAQSNHCRQTAAAARKAGMRSILVLTRSEHNELQGNLLLDALLDADIRMFAGGPGFSSMAAMEKIAEEERGRGHHPYIIPIGGSNGIGALGYAHVVLEMQNQFVDRGIRADYVYAASGSGGPQGGLVLGAHMYSAPYKIVGVSPGASGTAMAQQHLRNILVSQDMPTLGQPEAFVQYKDGLFDADGRIGVGSAKFLQTWMDRYVAWVKKYAA